jgi:hypothetical protein
VTRARQGRLVVVLNIAIGVGLIAVIASVSLFRQDARPPSLGEFAPAGGRALTDVRAGPPTPAARTAVRPSPVALPRPVGVAGVPPQLACYGWPDGTQTQTFDPQSPPCVSRWDVTRGNGGATASGVTATAVRVGVDRSQLRAVGAYASWFDSHFELYGRSVQLVGVDLSDLRTPEAQQAAATAAVQQQLFAVLVTPPPTAGPAAFPQQFLDVAADHGIITLLARTTGASSTALSALSPHAWSYAPGLDVLEQAAGDVVCELMAGRKATLSPQQSGKARRFGVVVPDAAHAGGNDLDVQTLSAALQGCHSGVELERVDPSSPSSAADALRRLKIAGVTTVVPYLGAAAVAHALMPAAEDQGYRPEWVLSGIDDDPAESVWSRAPAKQLRGLVGLASWQPSAALHPARRVGSGVDEPAYRSMLMLASGLQLAGPELTPETFGAGLSATAFPNPGAGSGPLHQAAVGFDDLDHAMVDDVALARWRPAAKAFCLIGGGTRWTFGNLPKSDPGLLDPGKECS